MNPAENKNQKLEKTIDKKPKSEFQEHLAAFVDFKKSPTLNTIKKMYAVIPTNNEIINFVQQLPEKAQEYLENKELEKLADAYQQSGVTNQYIKYANRKLLLRDEIKSISENEDHTTEEVNATASYLYGKYERFLCDKVAENGASTSNIQYALFQLSNQKNIQNSIRDLNKNELINKYFPGVQYEGDLPEFEIEYLPFAIHIKSNDNSFIQNLFYGKVLTEEEKLKANNCGGFYLNIEKLNIITELIYDMPNGTNTKKHELFHAEMKIENAESYKSMDQIYEDYPINKISEYQTEEEVSKNLKILFDIVKLKINEEVMAFFSEENHDFNSGSFIYYFNQYAHNNDKFDERLAENKHLTPKAKSNITTFFQKTSNDIKLSTFELKDALQIMLQKGYPKDWVLSSFSGIDSPPVFLENTNPKALAMSLPNYDAKKIENQKRTFEKISDRHQKKLEVLKNTLEFSDQFMSDLKELFSGEGFFVNKGIFSTKKRIELLISEVSRGGPVNELKFGNYITEIFQKYGDSQVTRQTIVAKLNTMMEEAKQQQYKRGLEELFKDEEEGKYNTNESDISVGV